MWFQSSLGPFTEKGSVVPSGMEYPVKFRPIPTEFCGYWDPPGRIRHCRAGFRRGVRPCPGDTEPAGWIVTGFGTFRALTRRVGAEVGRSWPDLGGGAPTRTEMVAVTSRGMIRNRPEDTQAPLFTGLRGQVRIPRDILLLPGLEITHIGPIWANYVCHN